ncbi:unnamed protein product, partial [Ixodes hexagonus]
FVTVKSNSVQKFGVTPSATEVNPGDSVALQCKVLNRRGDCIWLKNGVAVGRIRGKYNYRLEPEDGDCSVLISNATLEMDDGSWQCQVSKATRDGAPINSSEVKLVVREQPHSPRIEEGTSVISPGGQFKTKAGDARRLQCLSRKGNPPALLRWFLGSQDVSHLANHTNLTDEEKARTWKAVSVLDYAFVKADNRKELKCVAYHSTYDGKVKETGVGVLGHRDVTFKLNV